MTRWWRAAAALTLAVVGAFVFTQPVGAQTAGASQPFAITDNSFFVEEAFNQERGIFQNIFVFEKVRNGGWDGSFTQEFPAPAMRHQLSYTLPFDGGVIGAHVGGVMVNYRFQALEEGPGHPAFSPRFSVLLPTGRAEDFGDRPGFQINLPLSKQFGDFYLHANAGVTQMMRVRVGTETTSLASPLFAGSVIYRLKPMLNLMLESGVEFAGVIVGVRTARERSALISPGLRTGWNFGETQVVIGVAVPITTSGGESTVALLGYFSYELPFSSKR